MRVHTGGKVGGFNKLLMGKGEWEIGHETEGSSKGQTQARKKKLGFLEWKKLEGKNLVKNCLKEWLESGGPSGQRGSG